MHKPPVAYGQNSLYFWIQYIYIYPKFKEGDYKDELFSLILKSHNWQKKEK